MARKPSQNSIALALGVSAARVSRMAKAGMPTDSIASARAWKDEHVRPRLPNVATRRKPDTDPPAAPQPVVNVDHACLLELLLRNYPVLAASMIKHHGMNAHQAVRIAASGLFDLCAVLAMARGVESYLADPLPPEIQDAIEGLDTDLTRQAIETATSLADDLFQPTPETST